MGIDAAVEIGNCAMCGGHWRVAELESGKCPTCRGWEERLMGGLPVMPVPQSEDRAEPVERAA